MKETPKAQRAWNDYLAMGDKRSIDKLFALYESVGGTKATPTLRLRTLKEWSVQHRWQARLAEVAEQERQKIVAQGIALKQNRVDALNDRWRRMQQVIAERAENIEVQNVPGGVTGLIVHNVKGVGKGDDFQLIDLYEVDTALLREMREHEKQAAQELEQWTEKRKHTFDLSGLTDEELDALEHLITKTAES